MRYDARHAAAVLALLLMAYAAWATVTTQSQAQQKQKPKGQQQQQTPDQQQQQQQQQPGEQPPPPPPPKGPLTKKVTLKSSHQGQTTASAGFNGVGPDGKVQDALLKANPTSDDSQKAMQLSIYSVSDKDLQAFADEGKLKLAPAAKAGK